MAVTRHYRQWDDITEGRECGPCYACCVHLGIEELKKWSGQTCKHLSGVDATKRCSIYDKRPHACHIYECMWRAGWGPDDLRPYESGLLITPYRSESDEAFSAAMTVIITDEAKARNRAQDVAIELLTLPFVTEVRVVNYKSKKALLFKDGAIYQCNLLPPDGYEALIFEAKSPPVGYYVLQHEEKE